MRKHLFIGLLTIQLVIIIFFVIVFSTVEWYGKSFQVITNDNTAVNEYHQLTGYQYVEFAIDRVEKPEWTNETSPNYQDTIYVLLTENAEGIHELTDASLKNFRDIANNQIVILASYDGFNRNEHRLYYPFQSINNIEQYGDFHEGETLLFTIYKGLFGQYEIATIESYE